MGSAGTFEENVEFIDQQDLPTGFAKEKKDSMQETTVVETTSIDATQQNLNSMKIEEIVDKPVVMKEEVSSQNIQGATTTAEHTTSLAPNQSRRSLEKAKKSREP